MNGKRSVLVIAMALSACTLDSEPLGPGVPGPEGPAGTSYWVDGDGQVSTEVDVGIGTDSPETVLHVVGDLTVEGNLTVSGTLTVNGRLIGACPADMVAVGDVCVDKYEASVWSEPNGGGQYGASVDDYPCLDNGQNCATDGHEIFARSVVGVTPSRFITWFQAAQACANVGKHLVTNAEWQMAAAGTPDDSDSCNVLTDGTEQTGSRTECVSTRGAFDMVGNLWEWTANWFVAGLSWQDGNGDETMPWPDDTYGNDTTLNVNGKARNGSGHFANGLPAVARRSRAWMGGPGAGVFAMSLDYGPSESASTTGFRCARRM